MGIILNYNKHRVGYRGYGTCFCKKLQQLRELSRQ